jgi:hypothetical protein
VQLANPANEAIANGRFVLASQFWIFCLITAMLMLATWAWKALLEKVMAKTMKLERNREHMDGEAM